MSRNRIILVLILAFIVLILDAEPTRFLMKTKSGKTYLGVGAANKDKAESLEILNRQMVFGGYSGMTPRGRVRGRGKGGRRWGGRTRRSHSRF